jgi:hypothetical protein
MKFCIATLSHDAQLRAEYLERTIVSFLDANPNFEGDWFIFLNSYNNELLEVTERLFNKYSNVSWHLELSKKNLGVGAGINRLNKMTEHYEYVLFLEGDWTCLPQKISGLELNWINSLIRCFDSNLELDQMVLRRYQNDIDDRQFGYSYWLKEENLLKRNQFESLIYWNLSKKEYTNNPVFRRNKRFYEVGIFPLPEFFDKNGDAIEIKGNPNWGRAEIEKEPEGFQLNSAFLEFGAFVHDEHWRFKLDWDSYYASLKPCGYGGESFKCKYGYITPEQYFCGCCPKNWKFTDLEKHNHYFEQVIVELVDKGASKDDIIKGCYDISDELIINPDTYLNFDKKRGN